MLQRSSSFSIRLGLLAALAGALVLGATGTGPSRPRRTPTAAPAAKPAPKAMNSCATCLERGVLLSPWQLANGTEPDVRLSYEAARKYPDMLDRLHCFCECKESLQRLSARGEPRGDAERPGPS